MTIKFLNKHNTSFLSEPFAENIIYPIKYNKKLKGLSKKRFSQRNLNNNMRNNIGLTTVTDQLTLLQAQTPNGIKVRDWPYGPKDTWLFLYPIKGESLSANMKKAESQIIKQFFANNTSVPVFSMQSTDIVNPNKIADMKNISFQSVNHNKIRFNQTNILSTYHKVVGELCSSPKSSSLKSDTHRELSQSFAQTKSKVFNHCDDRIEGSPLSSYNTDKPQPFVNKLFQGQRSKEHLLNTSSSHFLFSLDQIKSEKLEQARLDSLKRIQNKNYSEFKNQLRECKKIRLLYGDLSKRDLQKSLVKVQQIQGLSSESLLIFLESRLDVILERCGFFPSIRAARQSVIHGRIQVNFKITKIPSFQIKPGNIIKVNLNTSNCTNIQSESNVQTPLPVFHSTKTLYHGDRKNVKGEPSSIFPKKRRELLGVYTPNHEVIAELRPSKSVPSVTLRSPLGIVKKFNLAESLRQSSRVGAPLPANNRQPTHSKYFKKSQRVCSSITTFSQIHLYFQSILFLFSLLKDKSKRANLHNLEKAPINSTTTSVVLPFRSKWRFNLSPHAILSILEIQSMVKWFTFKASFLRTDLQSSHKNITPLTWYNDNWGSHFIPKEIDDLPDYSFFSKGASNINGGKQLGTWSQNFISGNKINIEKSFLNIFYYLLQVKNKLFYPRSKFWREAYSSMAGPHLKSQEITAWQKTKEESLNLGAKHPKMIVQQSSNLNPVASELRSKMVRPQEKPVLENEIEEVSTLHQSVGNFDDTCIRRVCSSKSKKSKTSILYPSVQTNYLQKESKPLHLEISYSSLCAIYLFPPQQIYFSAIVDFDLISRLASIKK